MLIMSEGSHGGVGQAEDRSEGKKVALEKAQRGRK